MTLHTQPLDTHSLHTHSTHPSYPPKPPIPPLPPCSPHGEEIKRFLSERSVCVEGVHVVPKRASQRTAALREVPYALCMHRTNWTSLNCVCVCVCVCA